MAAPPPSWLLAPASHIEQVFPHMCFIFTPNRAISFLTVVEFSTYHKALLYLWHLLDKGNATSSPQPYLHFFDRGSRIVSLLHQGYEEERHRHREGPQSRKPVLMTVTPLQAEISWALHSEKSPQRFWNNTSSESGRVCVT